MPTFAFLVPVDPGLCVIPLEKAVVLIGRQADCDISLTQSRKVSRKHCCLAQVNNQIMARDLGSTNGIYLNGERVKRQCRLSVGDEFMIGDLKFRLQLDPNPPPRKPVPVAVPVVEKAKAPMVDPVPSISSRPTPFLRGVPGGELPSMEVPVILPDDGRDFVMKPSIPRVAPPAKAKHSDGSSGKNAKRPPMQDDSGVLMPVTPPLDSLSPLNHRRPGDSGPLVPMFPDEDDRDHRASNSRRTPN